MLPDQLTFVLSSFALSFFISLAVVGHAQDCQIGTFNASLRKTGICRNFAAYFWDPHVQFGTF